MKYIAFFDNDLPEAKLFESDSDEDVRKAVAEYASKHSVQVQIANMSANPPDSCRECLGAVWTTDYKECTLLGKVLPRYFRCNARLKACPLREQEIKD